MTQHGAKRLALGRAPPFDESHPMTPSINKNHVEPIIYCIQYPASRNQYPASNINDLKRA